MSTFSDDPGGANSPFADPVMADRQDDGERPCCIIAFEAMHFAGFGIGLWLSPPGMTLLALPWLCMLLAAALLVTRWRLALVWMLLSATCVGFLIFVPIGAAFQLSRFDENYWSVLRLCYVMTIAAGSLFFLWSRKTIRWMRQGDGRLSQLVF